MNQKSTIRLNLGCGVECFNGWINVDKFLTEEGIKSHKGFYGQSKWHKGAKFVQADILKMPFPDNYADVAEMHEVLEHFALKDVIPALTEVNRVLKVGGTLNLSCPSMDGLALDWLSMIQLQDASEFNYTLYVETAMTIYGNQIGDGEFHKTPFNQKFLNTCLVASGFGKGEILLYKKGIPVPRIGELGIPIKGHVLRNDTLAATVKKI